MIKKDNKVKLINNNTYEDQNTDYVRNIIEGGGNISFVNAEKKGVLEESLELSHDLDSSESEFGLKNNEIQAESRKTEALG